MLGQGYGADDVTESMRPAPRPGTSRGIGPTPMPNWMKRLRAGQMVAFSRLAVAFVALVTIYVDPSQPARYSPLAYYLLAIFVVYSGFLAVASERSWPKGAAAVAIHATDIVFFSAFAFVTEGPTSPFLLFFTFALFTGTLRWGWPGAVATALATVLIYWGLAASSQDSFQEDVSFVVIRGGYQILAGILFAYFGALLERERQRLADLASWPKVSDVDGDLPALPLEHVAEWWEPSACSQFGRIGMNRICCGLTMAPKAR